MLALILAAVVALALLGIALYWAFGRRRPSGGPAGVDPFLRLAQDLQRVEGLFRGDLRDARNDQLQQARDLREEVTKTLERVRESVENRLNKLQEENAQKLEQIRQTVDEKLQGTLEARLAQSFGVISERLEKVHQGLGEMQNLAAGVGDLKRVLTNVKTRGVWGEVQLGNLLEQMFTAEQYERNFAPRAGSQERVEFALRLPGRGDGDVWLPIDAKFPQEDYERLVAAADRADPDGVEEAGKALEARIKSFAKDIADKYIAPPRTTDYAILFLPTDGLYAEALRRPGLADWVQREQRVSLCGPTTLGALLNSLQMGFRTLAIQQRSSEVWALLSAIKTEFGKFEEALRKVHDKLQEASSSIEKVGVRRRAIERKLREVEMLPSAEAQRLLELAPDEGAADGE